MGAWTQPPLWAANIFLYGAGVSLTIKHAQHNKIRRDILVLCAHRVILEDARQWHRAFRILHYVDCDTDAKLIKKTTQMPGRCDYSRVATS